MATVLECLLHPIDCARAEAAVVTPADAEAAALRAVANLPADDPQRLAVEARVRGAQAARPPSGIAGIFGNVATAAEAGRDSVMWTSIAIGAVVIAVIVIMLTIVHFTNRI